MGKQAVFKLAYFIFILITLLLSLTTIIGAFACYCDPNRHALLAYTGLILPGLLVACSVLAFFWGIRRKVWVWCLLIAIGANYNYISAMFQYSFDKEETAEILKIATYNVHGFNNEPTGYSAKQIASYMQNEQADILCFQEFGANKHFNMDSLKLAFQEYPYSYIPILPDGGTRIATFSKYPLIDSLFISFPKTANCGMWVEVEVNNKTMRVFNVHMQTTSLNQGRAQLAKKIQHENTIEEAKALEKLNRSLIDNLKIRASQAKEMRKQIDQTCSPILFCGDFNDTPASYTYHELLGNLKDGFKSCGKGYGYTFKGLHGFLRIDYIFHSPDLKGISYDSPSLKWTDHNPVIMKVGL